VVRCLALARALEAEGAVCAVVVEPLGAEILARLGWMGEVMTAEGETNRLAAVHRLAPDAVVVDDYRLGARFESALPGVVMAIDDLADRPHACRLLLDSAYGAPGDTYVALAPGATLLLGPDYALLRDGFAAPRRELPQRVQRVFVSFGLSDVEGITARALALLRPLAPEARFDVAVGSGAPSIGPIRAKADPGVVLHVDADVAPLMRAADLGVGAGGGMVWERRAAGLPQLVVALADNQRPMTARLAAKGVIAAVDLADPGFEAALTSAFARLLGPAVRLAQIDNPAARCDGLGARRAARALLAEARSSR
jgi:UDP-2,4-diacetamido-2,4,6-trideoxy-beta-L-altropyranose hydrolase